MWPIKTKDVLKTTASFFVFVLLLSFSGCSTGERTGPGKNIILITIDSIRADQMSFLGYGRPTTPSIESFASQGIIFTNARSQAPWTLPSMASIFSSLYPSQHHALLADDKLDDGIVTIAEVLKKAGYKTMGIASHIFVDKKHGLAQGFDVFDESQIKGQRAITSKDITKIAVRLLGETKKQPFFLWIHYFDPHFFYRRFHEINFASEFRTNLPPVISSALLDSGRKFSPTEISYIRAVHEEEIYRTDKWIGRLLAALGDLRLNEKTIVFITADHGEYFMERGRFKHGRDVYKELIHVPLVIGGAIPHSLRGSVVKAHVETSSLPRTIVECVGIDGHPFQGVNLLDTKGLQNQHRHVFSEGSNAFDNRERKKAVVYDRWKLIYNFDDRNYELFDLETDPCEKHNLFDMEMEPAALIKADMKKILDAFPDDLRTAKKETKTRLSEKEKRVLRSMGYIK